MTGSLLQAIGITRETSIIHARTVSLDDLYNFRMNAFASDAKRFYPGAKSLSADKYDFSSLHVLYENSKSIAGAARIVRSFDSKLPLCDVYRGISINSKDLELSRFITRFDRTGKKSFVYLLPAISAVFMCMPLVETGSTIYADVLSGYPRTLNRSTYIEFGFEPTGIRSYDVDYALDCELFTLRANRLHIFIENVRKYQSYVGKLRLHSSVTPDFVQSVLLGPVIKSNNLTLNKRSRMRLTA